MYAVIFCFHSFSPSLRGRGSGGEAGEQNLPFLPGKVSKSAGNVGAFREIMLHLRWLTV